MADLAAWLLAQIAEDERLAARYDAAGAVPWDDAPPVYDFLLAFAPVRVLAECEAKRSIVNRCILVLDAFSQPSTGAWPDVNRRERHHARITLALLALPYADRPSYDEAWRP